MFAIHAISRATHGQTDGLHDGQITDLIQMHTENFCSSARLFPKSRSVEQSDYRSSDAVTWKLNQSFLMQKLIIYEFVVVVM